MVRISTPQQRARAKEIHDRALALAARFKALTTEQQQDFVGQVVAWMATDDAECNRLEEWLTSIEDAADDELMAHVPLVGASIGDVVTPPWPVAQ